MTHPLAQRLRDMHAMAGDACDPEFNKALLDAADQIDRQHSALHKIAIFAQGKAGGTYHNIREIISSAVTKSSAGND